MIVLPIASYMAQYRPIALLPIRPHHHDSGAVERDGTPTASGSPLPPTLLQRRPTQLPLHGSCNARPSPPTPPRSRWTWLATLFRQTDLLSASREAAATSGMAPAPGEPPQCDEQDFDDLDVRAFTDEMDEMFPPKVLAEIVKEGVPHSLCDEGCLCVCFHFLGAVVFLGRACTVYGGHFEVAIALIPAALYPVIGVCLPLWVSRLQAAKPLELALTIRSRYPFSQDESIRSFLQKAPWLSRATLAVGMAAWALSLVQAHTDMPGQDGVYKNTYLTAAIIWCVTIWMLGSLTFGPARLEEVALDASKVSVVGFINELKCAWKLERRRRRGLRDGESQIPQGTCWSNFAQKYTCLDRVLEALWAFDCVGSLWTLRITCLIASSIAFGAIGCRHPDVPTRWTCRACGVLLGFGGVCLLMRLASFSALCQSSKLSGVSIPAVVKRIGAEALPAASLPSAEDSSSWQEVHRTWQLHQLVLTVQDNKMGIEIFGVIITYDLVLSVAMQVCIYIPVALAVVGDLLIDRKVSLPGMPSLPGVSDALS